MKKTFTFMLLNLIYSPLFSMSLNELMMVPVAQLTATTTTDSLNVCQELKSLVLDGTQEIDADTFESVDAYIHSLERNLDLIESAVQDFMIIQDRKNSYAKFARTLLELSQQPLPPLSKMSKGQIIAARRELDTARLQAEIQAFSKQQ